jgi:hypothetical protein
MVDYRDQFLFLMLETFFAPENVGNFHNKLEPGVFFMVETQKIKLEK